jgi:acetoin utilization protein AcuB
MKISAVMTKRVVSVGMDDSLRAVRDTFARHGFHHLLVLDKGRVRGVVSDRDLYRHLSPFVGKLSERSQDASTLNRKAHQIMTRELVAASAEMTIQEAAALMLEHRVSCLPVVKEDGWPAGIVTIKDMLRILMCHLSALEEDPDRAHQTQSEPVSSDDGIPPSCSTGEGAGEAPSRRHLVATTSPAGPGTARKPVTGRQVRDLLDQLEASSQSGQWTVEQTRQSIAVLARAVAALMERELL